MMLRCFDDACRAYKEILVPEDILKAILFYLEFSDFASVVRVNKNFNKVSEPLLIALLKKLHDPKRQSLLEIFLKIKEKPRSQLDMDIEYHRQLGCGMPKHLLDQRAIEAAEKKTLHPNAAKIVNAFLESKVDTNDKILKIFVREKWFQLFEWLIDKNRINPNEKICEWEVNYSGYVIYAAEKITLLEFACREGNAEFALKLLNNKNIVVTQEALWDIEDISLLKAIKERISLEKFVEWFLLRSYRLIKSKTARQFISEQEELYFQKPSNPLLALEYAREKEDWELISRLLDEQKERLRGIFSDLQTASQFILKTRNGKLILILLESDFISTEHLQKIFENQKEFLNFIVQSYYDYEFINIFFKKNLITPSMFGFVYKSFREYPAYEQYNYHIDDKMKHFRVSNEALADFLDYASKEVTYLKEKLQAEHDKSDVFWMHFDRKEEKIKGLNKLLNAIYDNPDVQVEQHITKIEIENSAFRKDHRVAELCKNLIEKQSFYLSHPDPIELFNEEQLTKVPESIPEERGHDEEEKGKTFENTPTVIAKNFKEEQEIKVETVILPKIENIKKTLLNISNKNTSLISKKNEALKTIKNLVPSINEVEELKALLLWLKKEASEKGTVSFIKKERHYPFFRTRPYGNTKTWYSIVGHIKAKTFKLARQKQNITEDENRAFLTIFDERRGRINIGPTIYHNAYKSLK